MNEVSLNDDGTPVAGSPAFLSGGGEMGSLVRAFDWASTDLGPADGWPQSLKTAVSICLGSRHPIVLWWGQAALTQFCNSACISFLGAGKHPWVLGRSGRESWSEIWPIIGPMIERVFQTGEATWSEDLLLVLDRALPREEAYFTFSYSPIRNEDGAIGGIFCACFETTGRVIGERRLKTLRDLTPMRMEAEAEGACEAAARALEENPEDVPFALIYLLEGDNRTARLAATTHLRPGEAASPCHIDLEDRTAAAARWPLRGVLDTGQALFMPDLEETVGAIRGGRWPESIPAAMIVPIPGPIGPAGLLVSGISPRVPFDHDYRDFLDLVAAHIGSSITHARAHEEERKRAAALVDLDRAKTTFFSKEALSWLPNQAASGPLLRPDEPPIISGVGVQGHILLADDNADMRDYVGRLLGTRCEVETVGDGVAALEAIRKRRPDLVLTDVMMPGLDGFGLLRRIRSDPGLRDLPVVMLSARAGEESRVEGLAAGADDYLVKPFSARELIARVERNLRFARLRRRATDDLRAMELLQEIGGKCLRDGRNFEDRLDNILRAAMAITGADKGTIRLVDPASGTLRIVGQQGFVGPVVDVFSALDGGRFMARDGDALSFQRIVIADLRQSDELRGTPGLDHLLAAGICAVEATPLVSSKAMLLGAVSTYFAAPHQSSERDSILLDILARQAADYIERELAGEAAARLAAIVESSDDAIVSKDLDGLIQSWNRGAERLFGYTAVEAIGRSITIIIPEERSSEEPDILARIRSGQRIDHYETVRRRKDGELLDVSLTISPVLDRHGHIVGASKIARDITKRRRAEAIQSEQQALLEMIATGKPLEHCLREITEAVHRLRPFVRAAILLADPSGSRIESCFTSDIPSSFGEGVCGLPINDAFIGSCGTAMFRGKPVTCPDIASDDRWSREWRDLCAMHGVAAGRSTPIFDSEGMAIGSLFISFATPHHPDEWDLHVAEIGAHVAATAIQHQQARQAVALRTAQFESLFNATPVGLCLVDAALRIREVNPVALPIFADVPDLIGRDFEDVMRTVWPREVAAEIIGQFHNTLESGDAYAPAEPALRWRERDQAEYYEWQLDRLRLPDAQYGVVCYFRDVSIQVAAGKAIVESEARLRHIIDSAQEYAIVSLDGGGMIRSWNAGAERLLGYDEYEALGQPGKIFFTPEDVAAGIPGQEITIAREAGRAASERWHVRKDGSRFWSSGVMLPLMSGEPDMFLKIFRDGTERRQAERRLQLLINELNHRVKNTLATIQAIVRQSFRNGSSGKETQVALEARLMTLARCHDLLAREHWEGTDLGELTRGALEPFAAAGGVPERFSIDGESVRLSPQAAQSLAMGIHELATNAVKHGSLSVPGGKVSVRWTAESWKGEDVVEFTWEERNGPPVSAPERKGYGSRLIERALAFEMGGSAKLDYRKSGVRCEVRIPGRPLITPR